MSAELIGQKRQNPEKGGPASKKANVVGPDNPRNVQILIPSGAVGALMGKRGQTIKKLRDETGCRIEVSECNVVYPGTSERICSVKGELASTMIVVGAILEKIQQKIGANHVADHFDLEGLNRTKEVVVSTTSADIVFGKNDESINEIREQTTANIKIFPKTGSEEAKMSANRVITIGHDSNEVLLSAVQRVFEKVVAGPVHAQPTSETQARNAQKARDEHLREQTGRFNESLVALVRQAHEKLDEPAAMPQSYEQLCNGLDEPIEHAEQFVTENAAAVGEQAATLISSNIAEAKEVRGRLVQRWQHWLQFVQQRELGTAQLNKARVAIELAEQKAYAESDYESLMEAQSSLISLNATIDQLRQLADKLDPLAMAYAEVRFLDVDFEQLKKHYGDVLDQMLNKIEHERRKCEGG